MERYRRRYAALPESLDALVPEFLAAVPVSACDGASLTYDHGLVEVAPHPAAPSYGTQREPYSYHGFRVSGSFYAGKRGGAKWKRESLQVPVPEKE